MSNELQNFCTTIIHLPRMQIAFVNAQSPVCLHVRHIHNAVAELAVPFRRKTNSMRFHKRSATYFAHALQTKEREKRVVGEICRISKPFLDFQVSFSFSLTFRSLLRLVSRVNDALLPPAPGLTLPPFLWQIA